MYYDKQFKKRSNDTDRKQYQKTLTSDGKIYIYIETVVIVKMKYKFTIHQGVKSDSFDIMRTVNNKKPATQIMGRTFWSWGEVADNYKMLAPHMTAIENSHSFNN